MTESNAAGYASCCVLSYERPGFLAEAIETLRGHAAAPFELIIHDDGSMEDGVVYELLDTYRRQGATVILNASGHNQGQGAALNRMFAIASGDPIIKLDHDLVFEPGWLQRVNEILASNRSRSRRNVLLDTPGPEPRIGLLGLLHYQHDPVASLKCKVAQHSGWQEHSHILGSGFAVTRDCWRKLGPFEEHSDAFAEDWAFQRKVTDSAEFVCALPDEDLVSNQGMGIGLSTVVVAQGQVCPIHHGPVVIG